MLDSRDIKELHPVLRRAAAELTERMIKTGYPLLITSTYRDFEYQNYLYTKGRTTPGSKVTNAKGGESMHNYRLAFDICKNVKGQEFSDGIFFDRAGQIGTEMGLTWGGLFKGFADKPHFQWTDGLTLSDLQRGKMPEDKKIIWEVKKPSRGAEDAPLPGYASKEEYDLIDTTKIIINEKEYVIKRILIDGRNFVELNSLTQAGFFVHYDEKAKIPVVVTPKTS